MGKKGHIRIFHPVRQSLSFQQVYQGKCAFVVPVQYRRLLLAVLRHLQQIIVLSLSGHRLDLCNTAADFPGCGHLLRMPVFVPPDQGIRRPDNLLSAAVIGLHEKNPRSLVPVPKRNKRLRVCCPESIDTLIFISYHEQIPALRRQ